MSDGAEVSRRTVLTAAVAGAVAAGGSAAPANAATALQPVSMATHIHGPFSEGAASYEAHLAQARAHGVDVVWWTDHDWRIAAHDHRRAVHFDGVTEPEDGLAWTWTTSAEGVLASGAATYIDAPVSPDDPARALRLTARGGASAGGILWLAATAWNSTYSTCIADTVLELDVRPETSGPDGTLLLQVNLSFHPERGGRPAGEYVLRYRVGGTGTRAHTTTGLLGIVDLPAASGTWNRLSLRPVEDVALLWPDLVAEDNSLCQLQVGVAAGPGRDVSVVVDRLLFHRERRAGRQGEEMRAEVLARYDDEYADVKHYPAMEVSLVRHLNWYGGDDTLPEFASPPTRDDDPAATAAMVDFLHSHGGIVCWNHPLDVETKKSLARLMIERRALGVDLIEIGRQPQDDLLWVYDVAARNALFVTAVAASDDHDGVDWLQPVERWLTYAWAPTRQRGDVVKALRRGAVWFVDPSFYRGTLDLRVAGTPAMGAVHLTKRTSVRVTAVATMLPKRAVLEVVTGVADRAGTRKLTPAVSVKRVAASSVPSEGLSVTVKPKSGAYLRTQVRLADGTLVAVSNPMWFLPKAPPAGIPADRKRRLD